jgi:hypothetical protein
MTTTPEQKIGYVFNLTTGLSDNQQLVISGNLALGATKEEMSVEFDKLLAVTDRLAAKHKAEKKKGEIAADEAMINSMKTDLAHMDATKDGAKLNTTEKNNREAMVRNIRHLESRVAQYQEELKAIEAEAK